jgi:hypothetical protein
MSNCNQHSDRDTDGRLLRKYRPFNGWRYDNTPKYWRKLHMTKPRRRANAFFCMRIMKGVDPDGMAFPLGNHKPHWYYW